MLVWIQDQAAGIVAGGTAGVLLREAVAFGLRLRAARLRGDTDPSNDAEAQVLDDVARKVAP